MFTYILLALIVYILYRFIFGFVLPIISASQKMSEKMREMQGNVPGYSPNDEGATIKKPGHTSPDNTAPKPSSKDYIEFEEIK